MSYWIMVVLCVFFAIASADSPIYSVAASVFFVGAMIIEKLDAITRAAAEIGRGISP